MILVDYSAISIGVVVQEGLAEEDLIRHVILNSLRAYNAKYRKKYGRMVLCMDHKSWRNDVFPYYKFRRKQKREAKGDGMKAAFEILNKVSDEIKQFLPWHVLHMPGAEGDDGIAAMVKYTQEFGRGEPVLIIAADSDYTQLLRYPNVEQFSTKTKKIVTGDAQEWLFKGIAKGQRKDGIPNIKSDDDVFAVEGKRQAAVTQVLLDKIMAEGPEKALTDREFRNWKRNELLMDFNRIPDDLIEKIHQAYEAYEPAPFSGVLDYLMARRCKNLIANIGDLKPGEL